MNIIQREIVHIFKFWLFYVWIYSMLGLRRVYFCIKSLNQIFLWRFLLTNNSIFIFLPNHIIFVQDIFLVFEMKNMINDF